HKSATPHTLGETQKRKGGGKQRERNPTPGGPNTPPRPPPTKRGPRGPALPPPAESSDSRRGWLPPMPHVRAPRTGSRKSGRPWSWSSPCPTAGRRRPEHLCCK